MAEKGGESNIGIVLVLWSALLVQLLALPLLASRHLAWAVLVVPLTLLSNTVWFAIHESFHGHLSPSRRANAALGHLTAVLFTVPYAVVRFGHLAHHRFNGALFDRTDLYDPAVTSRREASIAYYVQLLGGLYVYEVAAFVLFLLPRRLLERMLGRIGGTAPEAGALRQSAAQTLLKPGTVRLLRMEAVTALALLVVAFRLHGRFWPLLGAGLLGRALLLSFYNNIAHYGRPVTDRRDALNLALPKPLMRFYLNFYWHRAHHRDPSVPWRGLPAAAAADPLAPVPFARAARAQWRGPQPLRPEADRGG